MAANATAVWRARPSGSNTNGGGYDAGISGAGTDYSQQNAAQATGVNGTASGTSTFTDTTAANFTSAMVGNALWIASGSGFTVGAYFIVTFNSSTSVVLDRSPGTGTVAHWAVGGGWADFWTNTDTSGNYRSTAPWIVAGQTVSILGSGTPNPSSYVFDYTITIYFNPVHGGSGTGNVKFVNDPATPGYKAPPDTTGGMPCILDQGQGTLFNNGTFNTFSGLYIVGSSTAGGSPFSGGGSLCTIEGCVIDQFGFDIGGYNYTQTNLYGCEVFSSQGGSGGSGSGIALGSASFADSCNVHDCVGPGINMGQSCVAVSCIIAKCSGNGITVGTGQSPALCIKNNTIDGNTGHGISIGDATSLQFSQVYSNIISNQTGAGKFGITIGAGTAAANDLIKSFVDFNSFYNNTANYNAISAGAHDTALVTTPYNVSATEDYKLI